MQEDPATTGTPPDKNELLRQAESAQERGDLELARQLCLTALSDGPDAEILMRLAIVLVNGGQLPAAIRTLSQLLRLDPKHLQALDWLASLLLQIGEVVKAERVATYLIGLDPSSSSAHSTLGQCYIAREQLTKAIQSFDRAVKITPTGQNFILLAQSLVKDRQFSEATSCLREAIGLHPSEGIAYEMLGMRYQETGEFDSALRCFERANELNPNRGLPYYGIAASRKFSSNDQALIGRMQKVLDGRPAEDDQRYLRYALGKAWDDLGDYEAAIAHFDEANRLSKKLRANPSKFVAGSDGRLFRTFSKKLFNQGSKAAVQSNLPVFIVGMIRSGTSLVEQILSCHPDISPGGELTFWLGQEAVKDLRTVLAGDPDPVQLRNLADSYLGILRQIGPTAQRVTDKMPINYPVLGLMHLLFPNARIIHCLRDSLDTCLSIYTTFLGEGPSFAYDRETIVEAYREYASTMEHWKSVLPPDRFLEIAYEDLVVEPETISKRMIEFCGLEWSDNCLRPEDNRMEVRTPSNWQVRQPVYSTSVDRWRRYEPWLAHFRELQSDPSIRH